jgi:hypothetical protein
MSGPDIAKIAAGLTKAQREALLRGYVSHGRGMWPLHNALVDMGLFPHGPYNSPTPLGQQVRAMLAASPLRGEG